MGYELHIKGKENWYDDEPTKKISLQEWLDYIKSDATMRLDGFAEAKLQNGQIFRVEEDGLAVWANYSGEGKDQNHAWFAYSGGNVVVKNPDQEIINKMCEIASYFTAKVQGDEGELYEKADFINKNLKESNGNNKPWWKFW